MEVKMISQLKKETRISDKKSTYYYKALVFQFLDIGLFEANEMKKQAYIRFFSRTEINKETTSQIVKLLEEDIVLLEMVKMWLEKETSFNLKFLQSLFLGISADADLSIKFVQNLIKRMTARPW